VFEKCAWHAVEEGVTGNEELWCYNQSVRGLDDLRKFLYAVKEILLSWTIETIARLANIFPKLVFSGMPVLVNSIIRFEFAA